MEPSPQPDWTQARHIVREWMSARQYSIREMSRKAGLPPSVLSRFLRGETALETGSGLRLYAVLQGSIDPPTMHTFLETTGLLPLALLLSREPALAVTDQETHRPCAAVEHLRATRLMSSAYEMWVDFPVEALRLFQEAERAFGPASSQGGWAGLKVAEQLMNLGDYDRAHQELQRVQQTYEPVLDPMTRSLMCDKWGWYHYYTGNLNQAECWFLKTIDIAIETGCQQLATDGATHFLGRVYFEMGKRCRDPGQARRMFEKAKAQFDLSYQVRSRLGLEGEAVWDLFRKSEVLQWQGVGREARSLRDKAHPAFAGKPVHLYVRMADAAVALEEGQPRAPMVAAGDALCGWSQLHYAKGIADSLRFLGEWEISNGRPDQALERYLAAACVFPYGGPQGRQALRSEIRGLCAVIRHQGGRKGSQRLVWRIHDKALAQQGSFAWLGNVAIDRTSDVESVFAWLESLC